MPEQERMLERGRRLERRRYARISFGMILVTSILVIGNLLFSPNRTEVATALATAAPLITGLMGVFTAVILGYLGVSTAERIWKRDEPNADSSA